MKWNKYTLKTLTEAEDIIAATLCEIGVQGVEIEDKQPVSDEDLEEMFVDVLPIDGEDDGIAYVSFYLDPQDDQAAILKNVYEELDSLREFMDIGEGSIASSETEDKDWINNWKEFFHSFRIDDIMIVPSWEDDTPAPGVNMVIHIDPGTAFGTGMHETTRLCIRELKKYVKHGDKVLDIGTGSGILGIVALKLGADHVLGTDLDPCAVPAVADNKAANDIGENDLEVMIGNIIDDPATQLACGTDNDIVTANILAGVLAMAAPKAYKALKPGGIFITSGIIDEKEAETAAVFEKTGFTIKEINHDGEWVSITAVKG